MFKKLILPIFAAAVSFAQPPAGGPAATPPVTEIKAYLNLSDTQVTSIASAMRASADANRTIAEQLKTKQQTLQTALTNGSTDAPAIGRAMLEIQALRKQLETNHAKAREQALSFLSADQKTKLKALEDAEKLRDEIRQAHALQLLAPPAGVQGPGGQGPGAAPGRPGPRGFANFQD